MTQRLFCRKPFEWFELEASPDYPAYLCCSGWLPKSVGSVGTADPMQVWNSPAAEEIRASILDGSFRFCDRERCSALQEVAGPVSLVDDVDDPYLVDIIRGQKTRLDAGPKVLNCSYDPSCNLQCPSCRTERILFSGTAAAPIQALQERLLASFLPGLDWLYVTGSGDPIGSPTFLELLKTRDLAAYGNLKLHLHTNAQLLTPRRWRDLRPNIDKVCSIEVSIDAGTEATYRINRLPGVWARLLANMEFLGSLRREGTLELLRISFVVQSNNWREMARFVELGKCWGVDEVLFARLTNWGTYSDTEFAARSVHSPSHPDHAAFLAELRRDVFHSPPVRLGNLLDLIANTGDRRSSAGMAHLPPSDPPLVSTAITREVACHRPWTGFHLDEQGLVRPCRWATATCGQAGTATPAEIWQGSGFYYFREQMRLGQQERVCGRHCPVLNGVMAPGAIPDGASFAQAGAVAPPVPVFLGFSWEEAPPVEVERAAAWIRETWLSSAVEVELADRALLDPHAATAWQSALSVENGAVVSAYLSELADPNALRAWLMTRRLARVRLRVEGELSEAGQLARYEFVLNQLAACRATTSPGLAIELETAVVDSDAKCIEELLDLCARYCARPVFCVDPERGLAGSALIAALEVADKLLWTSGYGIENVAPALSGTVRPREDDGTALDVPYFVYASMASSSRDHTPLARAMARGLHSPGRLCVVGGRPPGSPECGVPELRQMLESSPTSERVIWSSPRELDTDIEADIELELAFDDQDTPPSVLARCERVTEHSLHRDGLHLCLTVNRALRMWWPLALDALRRARFEGFALRLPYWEDGTVVSALDYADTIDRVIAAGEERGWGFTHGRPDVHLLGLVEANQYPPATVTFTACAHGRPDLSVVVAVYDQEESLPAFCASLLGQAGAGRIEVVFVDDGSTDGSQRVLLAEAQRLASSFDISVVQMERAKAYSPFTFTFRAGSARQVGIEHSHAPLVVFLDPDQVLADSAIAGLSFFARHGFDAVVGCRDLGIKTAVPSVYELLSWRSRNGNVSQREHWWSSFFTGNALVSRELLERVGGFDESLQLWGLEDIDLGFRLSRVGARVFHTLRSRVHHQDGFPSGGGGAVQVRRMQRLAMEILYRKYLDREILETFRWIWGGADTSEDEDAKQVVPDAIRHCCSICGWKGKEWGGESERDCPTCEADPTTRLLALLFERLRSRRWRSLRVLDAANLLRWPTWIDRPFAARAVEPTAGGLAAGASVFQVAVAPINLLQRLGAEARKALWLELARVTVSDGLVIVPGGAWDGTLTDEAGEAGWRCFRVESVTGARRIGALDISLWAAQHRSDPTHPPI